MYIISNELEMEVGDIKKVLAYECVSDDIGVNAEEEGIEMFVMNGVDTIVKNLVSNPNIEVLLEHVVVEVTRNNNDSTIIKCSNGKMFEAKNVICSVPLGVLKAKTIKFQPELPAPKQTAIERLGFGNTCKIFITLNNGLTFAKRQHGFDLISEDIQKRGLATFYVNLEGVAKVPALMTFGFGENAHEAETMPEGEMKKLIAKRLSIIAKKDLSPEDFNIFRTSWSSNPHFLGSTSFVSLETEDEDYKELAKPIF